jgi:hypothetical protein
MELNTRNGTTNGDYLLDAARCRRIFTDRRDCSLLFLIAKPFPTLPYALTVASPKEGAHASPKGSILILPLAHFSAEALLGTKQCALP